MSEIRWVSASGPVGRFLDRMAGCGKELAVDRDGVVVAEVIGTPSNWRWFIDTESPRWRMGQVHVTREDAKRAVERVFAEPSP